MSVSATEQRGAGAAPSREVRYRPGGRSSILLTHLDLFSGIGGFSLAAEAAGWRTVGFAETDDYASKVLKRHWPDVPNYGDVRAVPARPVGLVTGGFPCQPFSLAGKQRGAEDDRYLWPEMLSAIQRCRPAWVLGENVPGLIRMGLDTVLSDLEGEGYACRTFAIPAVSVGAWHRRERVWIVAYRESDRRGQGNEDAGGRREGTMPWQEPGFGDGGGTVADAERSMRDGWPDEPQREAEGGAALGRHCGWESEPNVDRVVNGPPNRTHRLRCLGNAIVPQVAYPLLCWMREAAMVVSEVAALPDDAERTP